MDNLNPFVMRRDSPQHVSWKHFKDGVEYSFELILPFKAILMEYNGTKKYICVCVIVCENQELNVSELLKDELVIIDLPIKTFARA